MSKKNKLKKPANPKINRHLQPVIYALGFLLILLLLSQFVKFIISLNSPQTPLYTSANEITRPLWDGRSPVNIVLKSATISVLSYNPIDRKLTILSIPDSTYFKLSKSYGSWPISSVFKLGEEEKTGRGASLLKESISALVGLPIDGFIEVSPADQKLSASAVVEKLRQNAIANAFYTHSLRSDLSPLNLWQFSQHLAGLRSDKIVFLNLGSSDITESKLLPDSSRVLGVNTVSLDLFIRDKLFDPTILKEAYPVAIYNATNHPGLAVDVARTITNLGGNVIAVANTEAQFPQSAVLTMNGNKADITQSYSFARIAQMYAPNCLKHDCPVQDHKIEVSRAQIIIVLGEDYYNSVGTR